MKNKFVQGVIFVGLIFLPIVLFLLPASYFDTGETVCLSKRLLDIECLGCGLTRGIQHLIHLDFQSAWHFNKLTFVVFPLFVYLYITWFLNSYRILFCKD